MTVKIKIVTLVQDLFIIKPQKDPEEFEFESKYRNKYHRMKEYLKSLGFEENRDFTTPKDNTFIFTDKSLVLRALCTIPQDKFEFESYSMYRNTMSLDVFLCKKNTFALELSSDECFASDAKYIKQIDINLFNYIKNKIIKAHADVSPKPHLMEQLEQDLDAIEKYEDDVFIIKKCILALSSVMFAYKCELQEKTIVKPFTFLKGASLLAPMYKELIDIIVDNISATWIKALEKKYPDFWFVDYDDKKKIIGLLAEAITLPMYHKIVISRRLNTSQPANLPPGPANPIIVPSALSDQLTTNFLNQFKQALITRRNAIQKRVDNGQWFQDRNKIILKKEAIDRVITTLNSSKNPTDVLSVINANKEVLTQSTSTLPTFFRNKVSSVSLLEDFGRFLK